MRKIKTRSCGYLQLTISQRRKRITSKTKTSPRNRLFRELVTRSFRELSGIWFTGMATVKVVTGLQQLFVNIPSLVL